MKKIERIEALEKNLDKLEKFGRFLNESKVAVTSAENHQKLINSLEKRVQALENGTIQIDPLITDKNGNGIVTHKDGGYTVYPNMDVSKSYVVPNPNIEPNIISDWLENEIESDLIKKTDEVNLSEVKQQVIELIKATELPDWDNYIAVDEDGEVFYDTEKPTLEIDDWLMHNAYYLGYIKLNDADWTKCCWKISELIENSDVKKNFTTEDSVSQIAKTDTQPDWENVLSEEDFYGTSQLSYNELSSYINRKIHELAKPLLEDNNSLHEEVISLEDKLEEANKVIANLKATFNDRLLDATRNTVEALQETQLDLNEKIKEGMSCKYYDIMHGTIRPTRPIREHLYDSITEYLLISDPPIDSNITIDDLVEFRGNHPTEFRNAFISNTSVGATDIDYFFKHYNYAVEAALNETIAMWVQMYWLDFMNQFSLDDSFVDFSECDFWTHPDKIATLYCKDRSEGKLYFKTDMNFDEYTRGHIQNKVIINVEEFTL